MKTHWTLVASAESFAIDCPSQLSNGQSRILAPCYSVPLFGARSELWCGIISLKCPAMVAPLPLSADYTIIDQLSLPRMYRLPRETRVYWGWGVPATLMGDNGLPVHGTDGKIQKTKVRMTGGYLHNGTAQSFCFPESHIHTGLFKGIAKILMECGLVALVMCRAGPQAQSPAQ